MPKMTSVQVKVKHNGKAHDVTLDPSQPASAFKTAIHQCTGVPPERQKVMIKGGMLKDDTDMTKLNAKIGQTFMVIGTAGELPKAPTGPVTFLEDMSDSQLALATREKAGLVNLGNTCYLASTLQVLRSIPELQVALNNFSGNMGGNDGESNLTASLRDLYKNMNESTDAFPPLSFLTILRQVAPQFAEMARSGGGYAQQDAEEAWVRITNALQQSLGGLPAPDAAGASSPATRKFVEQYMTGHMLIKRSSKEAPNEAPSFQKDPFSILQCNISNSTNEMTSGILDALNQEVEKQSESLGRTAIYEESSRIDRLPKYLTTHFVRFYWRRDIGKKTKIMRKVKFPFDLDATPFLTDELKGKVQGATSKIRSIEKERDERVKIRKKARIAREAADKAEAAAASSSSDAAQADDAMAVDPAEGSKAEAAPAESKEGAALTVEEEIAQRQKEAEELQSVLDKELVQDTGANTSALYELVGIVTHKGAAADAGHYISWVRKDTEKTEDSKKTFEMTSQDWYKFDDDKVSTVSRDKISMLDGGGEDSVAYILLYRFKTLD